jgi:hypothetical protein
MFKQQARAYVPGAPTELEWLAIAQHYGLPTRLLDWTDSFLVSAWFAVEQAGSRSGDSAIWVTNQVPFLEHSYSEDVLNFSDALVFRPAHISPRIAAQGSVLMVCPKPCANVSLPFVKKITISREVEFILKKRLNACGINRRQLFPDLGGLSDHLAWMYKHDWLAGYR